MCGVGLEYYVGLGSRKENRLNSNLKLRLGLGIFYRRKKVSLGCTLMQPTVLVGCKNTSREPPAFLFSLWLLSISYYLFVFSFEANIYRAPIFFYCR